MKPSDMVRSMYAAEADSIVQEEFSKTVSINLSIKDAAMLKAISERMGRSMFNLGGEILHSAIEEMFYALEDADKVALGEKADSYAYAEYEKKGIKVEGTYAHNAKGDWEGMALFQINYRQKRDADSQLDIEDQIGGAE